MQCPIFQQYQMYIRNFSSSLVKIHKICNSSADFFNLLKVNILGVSNVDENVEFQLGSTLARKVLEEDQKCNRLDITSFLLTPVQRIPRYVLLLKVSTVFYLVLIKCGNINIKYCNIM